MSRTHATVTGGIVGVGYFVVACEAALVVVSIVILALPEARSQPLTFGFWLLWMIVAAASFIQMRKAGVLHMTPNQMRHSVGQRPRTSMLSLMAAILSCLAMVIPEFH